MFRKIALLFLVFLAIYLILPDVHLSPDAGLWVVQGNNPVSDKNNLFNALVGLSAAADENMTTAGISQVQEANTKLAEFLGSDEHLQTGAKPGIDIHWTEPALVPTEGVIILCEPRAQDCRDIWMSQKDTIEQLLAENKILLNRYQELQTFHEYRNTLAIDIRSPFPDYSTLMTLNRLYGAGIALRYMTEEPAAALIELKKDMVFLRRLISRADTMIIKMVALSMLKHDLYLYASLMDTRPAEIYQFDEIPFLTEPERSFEEPIKYEFRMNMNLAHEIKTYPQLITGDLGVPAWLPFPLYRVNHSINMIHAALANSLHKSQLSAGEFNQLSFSDQNDIREFRPGWLSYMYNPIGCILFSISLPDFNKYIIRIHDMDGLTSMINLKRHIKRENLGPGDIEKYLKQAKSKHFNPYTGQNIDWNPGEQTLSFQSPGSDFVNNKLNLVFVETPDE